MVIALCVFNFELGCVSYRFQVVVKCENMFQMIEQHVTEVIVAGV